MELDLTLGCLLLSVVFSAIFFGVLTVQVHIYFDKYKKDSWDIRGIVAIVWILELLHQILLAMWIYQLGIQEFGNEMFMTASGWRIGAAVVCMALTAFIVQLFYTRRGYLLKKSLWPLFLFTLLVALLGLATGLDVGIELMRLPHFIEIMPYRWLHETWFSASAIADILVSVIVVYTLRETKTASASTRKGVRNIMSFTLSTGIVTSIFAFSVIVAFQELPYSFIPAGLNIILTRIYSNSLLASLNLRGTWVKSKMSTSLESGPPPGLRIVGARAGPRHVNGVKLFPASNPTGSTSTDTIHPSLGGFSEVSRGAG